MTPVTKFEPEEIITARTQCWIYVFLCKGPPPLMTAEEHLKQIEGSFLYGTDLPAGFAAPRDICRPHVGFWQLIHPLSASSTALAGNG